MYYNNLFISAYSLIDLISFCAVVISLKLFVQVKCFVLVWKVLFNLKHQYIIMILKIVITKKSMLIISKHLCMCSVTILNIQQSTGATVKLCITRYYSEKHCFSSFALNILVILMLINCSLCALYMSC